MMLETLPARPLAASLVAAALALTGFAGAAQAQSSPSVYTSATRYDAMGRVTGTIAPDPDGAGQLKYAATRTTYDAAGRPIKVETGELAVWQSEAIEPKNWPLAPANPNGFTILSTAETTYDVMGRKVTERVKGSDLVTVSMTQYSYDIVGRPECTAVRMSPAAYGSLPASACTLGTEGANGPDRITKNIYDAAGQLLQVRKAVGTAIENADVTMSYTLNGQVQYVIDANGNKAEKRYDGHDRQSRWVFPSKTLPGAFNDASPAGALASAGALNEADYELYAYDANGNRTSLRKRDASTINYQYDALNRITVKTVPARAGLASIHTRNVYYAYDNRDLQIAARFDSTSGQGSLSSYDGFGRLTSVLDTIDAKNRTLSYLYDRNGNRLRTTFPDAAYFTMDFDGLGRVTALRDQAASALLTPVYNDRGLASSMARLGTAQDNAFGYDPIGRLASLSIANGSSPADVSWSFARNPASQILSETRSNDSYAWGGHVNVDRNYTANGLNQYEAAGSASFCYDANGNLTADGGSVYLYDIENRLVEKRAQTNSVCTTLSYAGTLQAELRYDPLGRLYYLRDYVGSNGITRFLYDGDAMVAEYDDGTTMRRRYVHGSNASADDPLIWYEGSSVASANARYLYADPRGSIVLVANSAGGTIAQNSYDEYGINGSANAGRFQYTGQAWLPELGMYYYKARIYSPTLGRFLQTDPIGYEDQFNLYAYVGNDPINGSDPTGLCAEDRCMERLANAVHEAVNQPPSPTNPIMKLGEAVRGDSVRSTIAENSATIASEAKAQNIDGNLVKSVIYEEQTHLDPFESEREAIGLGNTVGLGQVTVGTGGFTRDQLLEPATNIKAMSQLISGISSEKLIDPSRPIASIATRYNCGSCGKITAYGQRVEQFYQRKDYQR